LSFTIKDSGEREEYSSGMVRDTATEKTDYSLVLDGPMFERWAVHLTNGAKKYSKRNWMLAAGQPELVRFKESALRHFIEWYRGDIDEDHAAAVIFNINGAEFVQEKLNGISTAKQGLAQSHGDVENSKGWAVRPDEAWRPVGTKEAPEARSGQQLGRDIRGYEAPEPKRQQPGDQPEHRRVPSQGWGPFEQPGER